MRRKVVCPIDYSSYCCQPGFYPSLSSENTCSFYLLILLPDLCISQIEASTSPPLAYPGHLTSFPAREGGNLINLVFPGRAFDRYSWGVGNLIASLDFMLRVALIPRGAINHSEDKPSCIQSEKYPIRGGLAKKQRLAQTLSCI